MLIGAWGKLTTILVLSGSNWKQDSFGGFAVATRNHGIIITWVFPNKKLDARFCGWLADGRHDACWHQEQKNHHHHRVHYILTASFSFG